MSRELFSINGERKYLTHDEVLSFLDEAQEHERAEVRTLCMFMAYTGCRVSEALEMTPCSTECE